MNPVKDLYRMVTMPLKAVFVVGLCWAINAMTYQGTWWVKWVALGMGIATVVALAKGLRTLLVLALAWWVGRRIYERYGPAARARFDAWMAARDPSWAQARGAAGQVLAHLQGAPGAGSAWTH